MALRPSRNLEGEPFGEKQMVFGSNGNIGYKRTDHMGYTSLGLVIA